MFNKFELLGIVASVLVMAIALYLLTLETSLLTSAENTDQAAQTGIVMVGDSSDQSQALRAAIINAAGPSGELEKMIIDDVKIGTGEAVKEGDSVTVHYIGTLQNGQEFDNSNKRGTPYTFKVGDGKVIKGWEEGILGMKAGGSRILVIPPELAYGESGYGPIPGNASLVFAIELLSIN